jgi:hypothetical protein
MLVLAITDTTLYTGLEVAMIFLGVICFTFVMTATYLFIKYMKLKRIAPVITDEGAVIPPKQIYDTPTICELVMITSAILAKLAYFVAVMTNLKNVTQITYNILVGIEIVSLSCICGSMGVELMFWLKY